MYPWKGCIGVEACTVGTDWKSADCLAIGGFVIVRGIADTGWMATAVDCPAVGDIAGFDCLAVACWVTAMGTADTGCMAMAEDCIAVEGLGGTNCLLKAMQALTA